MATRLTPIGWISKYLVLPAGLAAVGFFLIGPRIGTSAASKKPDMRMSDDAGGFLTTPSSTTTPSNAESSSREPNPSSKPILDKDKDPNLGADSDSGTDSIQGDEDAPKPRTRRRSRPTSTESDAPTLVAPPTDPNPDDGGSAGGTGATQTTSGQPAANSTSGHNK